MRKLRLAAWALAAILCAGLLFSGCGKDKDEDSGESEAAERVSPGAVDATVLREVGSPSDGAPEIQMTNRMGAAITGLTVKSSTESEYPPNMMEAGQRFEEGATVAFFYAPGAPAGETQGEAGSETGAADASADAAVQDTDSTENAAGPAGTGVDVTYTLLAGMEDGSVFELSGFAVDDTEEVTLCYGDGVAYLEYRSLSQNTDISTKDAELAIKSDKEAAQVVIDMIEDVGEVTLESADAIASARKAYDALTDAQKSYVTNADLLTEEEKVLASLQGEATEALTKAAREDGARADEAAEEATALAAEQAAAEQAITRAASLATSPVPAESSPASPASFGSVAISGAVVAPASPGTSSGSENPVSSGTSGSSSPVSGGSASSGSSSSGSTGSSTAAKTPAAQEEPSPDAENEEDTESVSGKPDVTEDSDSQPAEETRDDNESNE